MPLFRRHKTDINAITFPVFGWQLEKDEPHLKLWLNAEGTSAISVNYFPQKPDLPSRSDLSVLRPYYRKQISEVNGGLIEVETTDLKGYPGIRTLFKIPQDPTGTTYLGSLTLPFAKCSYVIKIQAAEIDAPGQRDNQIAQRLLMSNDIRKKGGSYEDWAADPYDEAYQEGTLMNKAERSDYDNEFPEHPLTQVRRVLRILEKQVEFSEAVGKLKGFEK